MIGGRDRLVHRNATGCVVCAESDVANFMKLLRTLSVIGIATLVLGACQNPPKKHSDDFAQKTHRTYNPETGTWEQSPPFGKESNKSDEPQ